MENEITIPDQPESMMPVIRKKESDYLGMYEYKREHEQAILKALIYGELEFRRCPELNRASKFWPPQIRGLAVFLEFLVHLIASRL